MKPSIDRRNVLLALAGVPAMGLLLSACNDSDARSTTAQATDAMTTSATSTEAPKPEGTVDMAKLLQPGALPDMQLGKDDAKVTIVEYASMTCPHCAHFDIVTLPDLRKKYIDTGKVRLILREFAWDPRAEAAFMLARCSKDKYFAMVDVLFHQQDNWARADDAKGALLQISKLAGFTQETFNACLTDQKLLDDIRAVKKRGEKDFGVDATPTFFINGKKYPGAMSIEEMSAIIDPLL
ncbi:MAG: disulfide bond formation protein DsbA [Rhizobiales bacterium 65-79]|jgi:protein-disulfide isomerase|nr:DsbA family protein [Hyphomicrobiales bacterium]OJU01946.1 MAG: disulfide bond formation protein DsbA [Rhizobiales bacterium 65-79]